jgi:hypothetical protein
MFVQEDGTPLVKLPKKEVEIVHLDFSKQEREVWLCHV